MFIPVPSMHGLTYESVNIKTHDNLILHAFWIQHPAEKGRHVPSIIYFHGNAGNMGHRYR